jgi:hypothetical protein
MILWQRSICDCKQRRFRIFEKYSEIALGPSEYRLAISMMVCLMASGLQFLAAVLELHDASKAKPSVPHGRRLCCRTV